jgi:tetratricopeptide (TPR) repeat protein
VAEGRARTWLGAAAIVLVVLVVYAPLRTATFVWDDDHLVYESPLVHACDGLARFWLTREAPDYFPLTNSTFWIEWRLWGMDARGYHATNVLLHAGSAILVWRILLQLGVPGAWLAALLFAVHPVSVGSVAWIAERKNTLSLFLASAATLAWVHFEAARSRGAWITAWSLFVGALLAKTSIVGLPLVLLGIAWWRRGRIERRDLVATAPFFAIALLLAGVTVVFQYGNVVGPSERAFVRPEGALSRLAAVGWCVWFYIGHTLWPEPLAMIHPRWQVASDRVLHWLPLIALAALGALAWARRDRGGRALLFALGGTLALLAPVLGLFDIYYFRYSLVAEHWLYAPMIPILALAVAGAERSLRRLGPPGRIAAAIAASAVAVVFAVLAARRAEAFESGVRLFEENVAVYPEIAGAHYNLGIELERARRSKEAARAYARALEIDPGYPEAHHNLARLLASEGDLRRAMAHYERAAELRPDSPLPLLGQGALLEAQGRSRDAIALYRRAAEIAPDSAAPHLALGFALAAPATRSERAKPSRPRAPPPGAGRRQIAAGPSSPASDRDRAQLPLAAPSTSIPGTRPLERSSTLPPRRARRRRRPADSARSTLREPARGRATVHS